MAQQVQEKYEESYLYKIRHSAAHVMAQAVMEIFPDGKPTIGPPVENGFYYDIDLGGKTFGEDDLASRVANQRAEPDKRGKLLLHLVLPSHLRGVVRRQLGGVAGVRRLARLRVVRGLSAAETAREHLVQDRKSVV